MFAVDIMMVSGNGPLKVTVTYGLGLASTVCSKESGMRSNMFSDVHCFLGGALKNLWNSPRPILSVFRFSPGPSLGVSSLN